jgi:hypothetical protein
MSAHHGHHTNPSGKPGTIYSGLMFIAGWTKVMTTNSDEASVADTVMRLPPLQMCETTFGH